MMDIRGTLTRQVGPLPLYAWGGIAVVGVVVATKLRGGASASPQVLGQVTDADPGTGGGSGDGATQPPAGQGSTGTVGGNGKSYTVLTVTGKTKSYASSGGGSAVSLAGAIPASSTRYVVKRVTIAGHSFYQVIGKLGAGNVFTPSVSFFHRLIPYAAKPTTYTIHTTTPTQAAA